LISNETKESNFEKYLYIFFYEIKKNDIWKKYEKDYEEFRIINNSKNSDLPFLLNNKNDYKIDLKKMYIELILKKIGIFYSLIKMNVH